MVFSMGLSAVSVCFFVSHVGIVPPSRLLPYRVITQTPFDLLCIYLILEIVLYVHTTTP